MKTLRSIALLFGMLFAVCGQAAAQESLSARYQDFLTSELYQLMVTSRWDQQARLICGDGAGRSGLKPGQLIELSEVRGPSSGPTSGAWIHRVPGFTCGKRRVFNFLVEFGPEGPRMITLLPGNTQTTPTLQRDALKKAAELVRARVPGCELPIIVDTALAGELAAGAENQIAGQGGWVEIWYFDACRRLVPVTLFFIPDGKGGTSFQVR